MKPIAIFRHTRSEGPGYFASYLDGRSIAWEVIAIDDGIAVPKDARPYSGLVFMGGPMSANDPLPWMPKALELIRDAVRKDIPVLGHCLGGQMMAKALGGEVRANPYREIGWGTVQVQDNAVASEWFGDLPAFDSFHWHGETFSIPPGGTRVLSNAHCANQAFVLGKHLGLQCHIEMTEGLVRVWCRGGREEIAEHAASPGVQPVEDIEHDLEQRLEALHKIADRVYEHWTARLARG